MIDYRKIHSERLFKDATGYPKNYFLKLLSDMENTYFEIKGESYEQYIEENVVNPPRLKSLGDALFFVLFKIKNDMIFGSLGVVFGMSESTAHDNFIYFSDLLDMALEKKSDAEKAF